MILTKTFQLLFVDDDADFRAKHLQSLTDEGFVVTEAGSEKEALAILDSQKCDIVVADLIMENADSGFTLSYHIKKKFPDLPVILVSTANSKFDFDFSTSSESERRWMKCDAMLPKPIRFEQLLAEAHRLLGVESPQHDQHH